MLKLMYNLQITIVLLIKVGAQLTSQFIWLPLATYLNLMM